MGPLNLTKSPPRFSAISITPGEFPQRILPYEFNTLEKVLEDSIDHADEMMCSICYVYAVGKVLKYSSCKNEEN